MSDPNLSKRASAAAQGTVDSVESTAWVMLQTLEGLHAGLALSSALPDGWSMNRIRLAVGKENEAAATVAGPVGLGVPIGVNDARGRPIHIGDTLDFDEAVYGKPCRFTITLEKGEIQTVGAICDLSEYCEIAVPWDAKPESKRPTARRP